MSLLAGLLAGSAIAVLEVAARHGRIETTRVVLSLNDSPLIVPFVLVPLALFWGWNWASNRWAGRSLPRLILFTIGLYATLALAGPFDALMNSAFALTSASTARASGAVDLSAVLIPFMLPATIAAPLYWLFGSGRLPTNRFTLGVAYILGPSLALLSPIATMGTVAGTAAGHAWHSPSARNAISFLVIMLLLGTAVGLPYVLTQLGVALPAARQPLLP